MGVLFLATAAFDVASVKRSAEQKGIDYRGRVMVSPGRVSGRNVTLQDMIAAAYHVQLVQVSGSGAFRWVDSEEFDIDARGEGTPAELRAMLKGLLGERFRLQLERGAREVRGYALVVEKGGPRLEESKGSEHFHGSMQQFADLLGIQATISAPGDPSRPAVASSAPIVVVDKTGLEGVLDLAVELRPEIVTDRFTDWQRALKEQLGLKLESQKLRLEVLVVVGASRVPEGN